MKKIIGVLILLIFVGGCATSVPIAGYTGAPTGIPKISNLKMPTIVEETGFFPISFNYKTGEAPIVAIFAVIDWRNGAEKIQLRRQKMKEGESTGRMRLSPNTARFVQISVYVQDEKGNKSNTLTREVEIAH